MCVGGGVTSQCCVNTFQSMEGMLGELGGGGGI